MACMDLHNFIRQSAMADDDFEKSEDENSDPVVNEGSQSVGENETSNNEEAEDPNMNQFRDWIADGLYDRHLL